MSGVALQLPSSRRDLQVISGLLLATIVAAVLAYGVKPRWMEWRELAGELAALESALAAGHAAPADRVRLEAERDALAARLAAGTGPRAPDQFEALVLATAQSIALTSGAQLVGATASGAPAVAELESHRFRIDLAGSYAAVASALIALETQLPYAAVEAFVVEANPRGDAPAGVLARVTLATWRQVR